MLWDYFKLCFIIIKVSNLDANLGGYFELPFIMTNVGNLYTNLGGLFWIILRNGKGE